MDKNDNDPDFNIEEHIEDEEPIEIQHQSRNKRAKKTYNEKSVQDIQQQYFSRDVPEDEAMEAYDSDISQTNIEMVHQWVYDLQDLDKKKESFTNNYLVILRGHSKKLSRISLKNLFESSSTLFRDNIQEVIMIQHANPCQLYILNNLQKSLHFSLGSKSVSRFVAYMKDINVVVQKIPNSKSIVSNKFFLCNKSLTNTIIIHLGI